MNTTNMSGGYGGTVDTMSGHTKECLYPIINVTRAWARDIASHNNTHLMCYEYYKWLFYWAFVIEYATLNSHKPVNNELTDDGFHQGGLGGGLTKLIEDNGIIINMRADNADIAKDKCRYIGVTNSLGNGTGELSIRTDTDNSKIGHPNRYRGFECPFGDIQLILDGFLGRTVMDDNNSPIYNEYYTCNNPEVFGDDFPTPYNSDAFENGWRIAYRDVFRDGTEREGYDEGFMMFANIGEQGDLFSQRWRTDENSALYYVNNSYPLDDSEKSIIIAGSVSGFSESSTVGLGFFNANRDLSTAAYQGYRCFNIIKDDGTVV